MIDAQGREIHGGPLVTRFSISVLNVFIDDEDDDYIYCSSLTDEGAIGGDRYRFRKIFVTWVNNQDGSSDVSMPFWHKSSGLVRPLLGGL